MKHTARLLAVTAWMSFAFPSAAQVQTTTTAPLPPAAQEAIDKGIIAAKVPDYALAVRYFEDARKLAPLAPIVFMNLGIAESKMPGRELRAIAWFGAYLAASPDAPNAAAVKEQIAVLEVRNQSNLSRFLKTTQDAANQTSVHKSENLCLAGRLWVKAGNTSEGVRIIDRLQPVPDSAYVCVQRAKQEITKAKEPPEAPGPVRETRAQAATGESERFFQQGGYDWLHELDGTTYSPTLRQVISTDKAPLDAEPFLDLSGHLKSQPPAEDPQKIFYFLHETAAELVERQNTTRWLLKRYVTR